MKRLFDLVISLMVLIVFAPVFIFIAVAIKLDSEGNILYCQERVGKGSRPFKMYKFRTLVADADKIGTHQTTFDDPRITKVGRLLRKTSLDELPQLLNVLKGDMSLVGPRPDVPAQKVDYTEEQWAKRTSVLPGITGLAQATRRSLATKQERLDLDIEYIKNQSFWLDIKIIGLTFNMFLSSKSAS